MIAIPRLRRSAAPLGMTAGRAFAERCCSIVCYGSSSGSFARRPIISRDGVAATNLVWKDTAIIPAGETVDLLVDMANPGRWMIHCHVAEHLGAGMMGVFEVVP